jgi:imidazolonepropionase
LCDSVNVTPSTLIAGTTLLESKTGYGLDYETELKMLKVLERGRKDPDIHLDISITYCAAHAVPK